MEIPGSQSFPPQGAGKGPHEIASSDFKKDEAIDSGTVDSSLVDTQAQRINSLYGIMQSEAAFPEKAELFLQGAVLRDKVESFKEENAELISKLQITGWMELKKTWTHDPGSAIEFEKFRADAVSMAWEVVKSEMKACGIEEPGQELAFGTPGWDSDVDTVFQAGDDVSQRMQIFAKLGFDMVMFEIFDRLPGFALDTESYLNHAGAMFKTEERLSSSSDSKAGFAAIEIRASYLQMARQLGGVNTEAWEVFKQNTLKAASGEGFLEEELIDGLITSLSEEEKISQEVLSAVFEDIEAFENGIQKAVSECSAKFEIDSSLALMSYKFLPLFKISEKMDELEAQMSNLVVKVENNPTDQVSLKQIDQVKLQLAKLSLIRTSFFDEGYNTQGSYNVVCERSGGQKDQRAIEKVESRAEEADRREFEATRIRKRSLQLLGAPKEIEERRASDAARDKVVKSLLSKLTSSREGVVVGKETIKKRKNSRGIIVKELVNMVENGTFLSRDIHHDFDSESASIQELFSAMHENLAMFLGHFEHKKESSSVEKAFVSVSKYSERAMDAAQRLLELIEIDIEETIESTLEAKTEEEIQEIFASLDDEQKEIVLKQQSYIIEDKIARIDNQKLDYLETVVPESTKERIKESIKSEEGSKEYNEKYATLLRDSLKDKIDRTSIKDHLLNVLGKLLEENSAFEYLKSEVSSLHKKCKYLEKVKRQRYLNIPTVKAELLRLPALKRYSEKEMEEVISTIDMMLEDVKEEVDIIKESGLVVTKAQLYKKLLPRFVRGLKPLGLMGSTTVAKPSIEHHVIPKITIGRDMLPISSSKETHQIIMAFCGLNKDEYVTHDYYKKATKHTLEHIKVFSESDIGQMTVATEHQERLDLDEAKVDTPTSADSLYTKGSLIDSIIKAVDAVTHLSSRVVSSLRPSDDPSYSISEALAGFSTLEE